jgi:hypothetical protein
MSYGGFNNNSNQGIGIIGSSTFYGRNDQPKRTSSFGKNSNVNLYQNQNQILNHSLGGNKNGIDDLITQLSKTGYNVPMGQR